MKTLFALLIARLSTKWRIFLAVRLDSPIFLPGMSGGAFDSQGMLYNAALTSTQTGTGIAVDTTPANGVWIKAVVPQATGTTPTLDLVIQESDTLGSGYTANTTFDQITTSGVHRRKVYTAKKYLRAVLTVTGTTPNFGTVQVGIDSGGEYTSEQKQ